MIRRLLVVKDEKKAMELVKIANNYRLRATYKIGVYIGDNRQHEVFVKGGLINYWKFIKHVDPYIENITVY